MPQSQYLAEATLNWFRNTAYPAPVTSVYLSIHSAAPGPLGGNADVTALVAGARKQVLASELGAPVASPLPGGGYESRNTVRVELTNSALAAATLTHYGLWSAASGGNFLGSGLITNPQAIQVGDIVAFAAGQLILRQI